MKLLILGANGMIGHRLLLEVRSQFNSGYGLIRRKKSDYIGCSLFDDDIIDQTDVSDWRVLESVLDVLRPDVIVNAIGVTIRREEMLNFKTALEINSFLPQRLSKWAQRNSSRLIHFSTDCVFGGEAGSYDEMSNPSAADNYGRSKFLGEVVGENSLTLRFSCIGRELETHSELLDWFLAQRGKRIKGYSRAMYSGVTSMVIAKEVCRIIKDFPKLQGLYQISSEPISKYDLLCLAKNHFKLDVDIEKFDNYVSDKTLLCEKYKNATGYKQASWDEMMRELSSDHRIAYKNF